MTPEDMTVDASVQLTASAQDSQDGVASAAPSEDEEDSQESTPEPEPAEDALSAEDLEMIDEVGKLSEHGKIAKIEKLMQSGREEHTKRAKILMEAFDLDVKQTEEQSLKQYGLTPEKVKELQELQETQAKKESVKTWAETLGITQTEILRNKDFVKAYHKSEAGSVEGKVDNAIKAFLKSNSVQDVKKKLATLKIAPTGNSTGTQPKKGSVDLETLLEGKSLDQIDLSQL